MVSGWFKHIAFTVHFIYNQMLPLICQVITVLSQELGDPCSKARYFLVLVPKCFRACLFLIIS